MNFIVLAFLCLLILDGCGPSLDHLVNTLEARRVQSCVYWAGIFGQAKGVTSTGGVPIETCLIKLGIEP
jgi:hypothetical protein